MRDDQDPSKVKMERIISVRMSDRMLKDIENVSKRYRMTVSSFIRFAIALAIKHVNESRVKPVPPSEVKQIAIGSEGLKVE